MNQRIRELTIGLQLAVTQLPADSSRHQDGLRLKKSSMHRNSIAAALALSCLAALTIPAQAQSAEKSDAECRLSRNGEVVYNDECTVKEKVGEGMEVFAVKFNNGKIFRFSGFNRQNLRI